jgi:hypothetical protein
MHKRINYRALEVERAARRVDAPKATLAGCGIARGFFPQRALDCQQRPIHHRNEVRRQAVKATRDLPHHALIDLEGCDRDHQTIANFGP